MAKATFKKGAKFERWERNLSDPRVALKQIGALMVAQSQRSFRDQGLPGEQWDARAPINVYGLVADFAAGKRKPPARRFKDRPALRDTGRLAASISFRVRGKKEVWSGSNLEYATTMNRGGEIHSEPIEGETRRLLWNWLKKQPPEMKAALGFLFAPQFRGGLSGETVARPFTGITDKLLADVERVVGIAIMEAA